VERCGDKIQQKKILNDRKMPENGDESPLSRARDVVFLDHLSQVIFDPALCF